MKTGDALIELGITPEMKGFQYIIDAIEEIQNNPGGCVIGMYEAVGEKNKSTASRVERAIRHAVETRLNATTDAYKKYVGTYPEKLTNSMFLYAFKYRLENMED